MGSLARKAIGGSIHKIREFELEKVSYYIIDIVKALVIHLTKYSVL